MDYQETLDYLYSFINHNLTRQERYHANLMTLQRMEHLMDLLGHPHREYPILHLTGTKGKGSVGAMSAAMLEAAGYRVGLYSSPHLQDFRERFKINQTLIDPQAIVEIIQDIKPALEQVPQLTWFEVVTALAFEYFRREEVEIALIEVGLGGRLDSTNVVTPLVSVITSLSMDHMAVLGNTIEQIATEKAGIIKQGIPVVSAPQSPTALQVLEQTAQASHSPLTVVGRDWPLVTLGGNLSREQWQTAPLGQPMQTYQTRLLGQHQAINGTVALATMELLAQAGWDIPLKARKQGLMNVNWPGRLEIVRNEPLVILDAAHNAASAQWLAQTLVERFAWQPRILVFAAKSDKDIEGMLQALLPISDHLIVTQAVDSRAEAPDNIATLAREQGYLGLLSVIPEVPLALQTAEQLAGQSGLVYVTGSLYLVGEARSTYGLVVGQAVSWKLETSI